MGLQKVGHDRVTSLHFMIDISSILLLFLSNFDYTVKKLEMISCGLHLKQGTSLLEHSFFYLFSHLALRIERETHHNFCSGGEFNLRAISKNVG